MAGHRSLGVDIKKVGIGGGAVIRTSVVVASQPVQKYLHILIHSCTHMDWLTASPVFLVSCLSLHRFLRLEKQRQEYSLTF